jgi:hypothetical protein
MELIFCDHFRLISTIGVVVVVVVKKEVLVLSWIGRKVLFYFSLKYLVE